MSFRLSKRAEKDIDDIWEFVARQSVDNADKVDLEIFKAMRLLADFPGFGHRRKDVTNPAYRFWSVYSYLIGYRIRGRTVTIVRVIHGARNLRRFFK